MLLRYPAHPLRRIVHMGKAKISEIKDKKQMVFISYSSTNEQKFEDCMKQMIKEHSTDTKKLA